MSGQLPHKESPKGGKGKHEMGAASPASHKAKGKSDAAVSPGNSAGKSTGKIAIVLIRGKIGLTVPSKDTLTMLNLSRKNHCAVVEDTPLIRGMLQKVKDFVTWGDLTEETFQTLVEKRGKAYQARLSDRKEKYQYNYMTVQGTHYKNYFALNPPRKGFGRKGIKVAFMAGGALGDRKEKINDLILRMV